MLHLPICIMKFIHELMNSVGLFIQLLEIKLTYDYNFFSSEIHMYKSSLKLTVVFQSLNIVKQC